MLHVSVSRPHNFTGIYTCEQMSVTGSFVMLTKARHYVDNPNEQPQTVLIPEHQILQLVAMELPES